MAIDKTKALIGTLGEIASLLHGAIASGLKIVQNLFTMGFGMAMKYNNEAIAFAREAGLSAKQAQAYTEVLTTRAKDLGAKYGIAAEAVAQLEKNLSRATGRVLMLSDVQTERLVQINKLVGENTFNEFAEQMFAMGGQISTTQGAVSKAYAMAAKNGLNAAKMSEKVAQNLGMANRLSFKNGIEGLTRMVMMSEKFGINMSTVESVANKFLDLQEGIETSASLTMLGGAIGGNGGNPLDLSYEALADPEALANRLTKMLAGHAQFDARTGMSTMGPAGMEYARAMSKALGVSVEELTKSAKKIAEVRYKEGNFNPILERLSGGDQNKKNFLVNRSQIENGKLKMADSRGNLHDMSYYEKEPEGRRELAEMMKYSNMEHDEIIEQGAKSLISIEERITGWMTTFSGMLSEKIAPYIPKIQKFLGDLFEIVEPHIHDIADNIKGLLETLFEDGTMNKIKSGAEAVIKMIMWLPKFLTNSWKALLSGFLLGGVLSMLSWGFNFLGSIIATRGTGGGMPGGGMPGVGARRGAPSPWAIFKRTRGRGVTQALGLAAKQGWKTGGLKAVKGSALIASIMAAYEGYNAISDYNDKEKEIRENEALSAIEKKREMKKAANSRNKEIGGAVGGLAGSIATGALVGTAIGGPIGTAVGILAGIGGYYGGKWLGENAVGAFQDDDEEPEVHHTGGVAGDGGKNGARSRNVSPKSEVVSAYLQKNEVVVPNNAVDNLYGKITAVPYDGKTAIYIPQSTSTTNVGNNTITVNDINVRFSGSVRLVGDGGQIDWKEITKDPIVIGYITNAVREAFSSTGIGRTMNDNSYRMNLSSSAHINGQMKNGFGAT